MGDGDHLHGLPRSVCAVALSLGAAISANLELSVLLFALVPAAPKRKTALSREAREMRERVGRFSTSESPSLNISLGLWYRCPRKLILFAVDFPV